MHYSQKRRYYFFIAIAKFKTILSYYPRWRKLPPLLLILRSTFAQPSLKVRSRFAQPSLMIAPHLRHTLWQTFRVCQSVWRKFPPPNAYPSSHTRLCQLADFPSLILRLSFAYPSLILRSTFAQAND